ncbi:MAG TPA: IPT/TIG domain-containing protein [Pantanalinema sp.]
MKQLRHAIQWHIWKAIALALVVTGCAPAGVTPPLVPELAGRVDFGGRKVQADIEEVALAATVSLIDTDSNVTVATTLTDTSGKFVLTFGSRFRPGGKVYYLEASKGLSSNLAGHDAVRLRTMARYQPGGWVTLTNRLPGVGIWLNLSTTALSVIASLEGSASIPPEGLLSTVTPGTLDSSLSPPTPDTFEPSGTGITNLAFHQVYGLMDRLLANDVDPVAGLAKRPDGYGMAESVPLGPPPTLLTIVPAANAVGTVVILYGTNFEPVASDQTVSFGGVVAPVLAATPTRLTVRVPAGAATGPVIVRARTGVTGSVAFTVTATSSSDIGGSFSAR